MKQISNRNYPILRNSAGRIGVSQTLISDIAINSEQFRNTYQRIILSHLSNSCQDRELIRITRCRIIKNQQLELRFSKFRRSLESQGVCSDVSFGFSLLSDNMREVELIAQFGLPANNNFVGDLGEPANGVYLSEHADLVTPAPFLKRTKIKILACKVLKGRCSAVGLGSYRLMPTQGYHSHIAVQSGDGKLTRHDYYRYDQIFLFEEKGSVYSKSPANVLPYAIFDVEFPSNTTLSYKGMETIVWSGSLIIGSRCYGSVLLHSLAAATKPPLLDIFEITDLIHWTACLAYPPILELLRPPALGEIASKKEVHLINAKRLVYHFTLRSKDDAHDFFSLHESMRVRRAAGIRIFPSFGVIIVIPNGLMSDLLALPMTNGSMFHCLYFTVDMSCSLINGAFEMMTAEENDEFTRPLLLQERVDGLDSRVQELVRNAAQNNQFFDGNHDTNSTVPKKGMPSRNCDPVDMDVADDSDDDDDKRGWQDERIDAKAEMKNVSRNFENQASNLISNLRPSSVNGAMSEAACLLSSDSRREKAHTFRDPRKRQGLMYNQNLPIPAYGIVKEVLGWNSSRERINCETELPHTLNAPSTDSRSYSPSDAISVSSGGSSPKTILESHKSSLRISDTDQGPSTNSAKSGSAPDDSESPASPPHEPGVFVAAAPKVISAYDISSAADTSFQTSARQYRPPEVTPFTALASMETVMDSRSAEQQNRKFGDAKACEEASALGGDNHFFGEKPMCIIPELVSSAFNPIKKTSSIDDRDIHSSNASSQYSNWDTLSSTGANNQGLSRAGAASTGDVDMRAMNSGIPSTAVHPLTSAIQAPLVLSNGDTDHRIIPAAVRPSTSVHLFSKNFLNANPIRSSSSFSTVPSIKQSGYNSSFSTSPGVGFEEQISYGFFNQPAVHRAPNAYCFPKAKASIYSMQLLQQGILVIDDEQFLAGTLEPQTFRMILERFLEWRKSSSISWRIELHAHLTKTFEVCDLNFNQQLSKRYAQYREIIAKYINTKVVQMMEPHECNNHKHNTNSLLKCLSRIANANRKCTKIYLTDIENDSPMAKQIASTGFEVYCLAEMLKRLGI